MIEVTMTLSIDLSPAIEDRLKAEAQRTGLPPEEYVRRLIESALPADATAQRAQNQSTLDLFAQWAKRDATEDADELARRQQELDEFKRAINHTREAAGARKIYP